MHLSTIISGLGYKPKEARVYLAALSLGESTVSTIATKVKLPRTSVQLIVDSLHKQGLMNFYDKKRYRYWVAENPEKLTMMLRENEAALNAVMPKLRALRNQVNDKPTVKVFKGADEIKFIHEDIVATQRPVQSIISWDEWVELLGTEYMHDFIERRVQHFLRIDLLVPKTTKSVKLKESDTKELRHTRFLPSGMKISTSHFVYGNKVAIISLNKKEPTAIIIDDPDIAHTTSVFFEAIWNQSGE